MSAAPLKQERERDVGVCRRFRVQMSAAPLKQDLPDRAVAVAACFRVQMSAAPLKHELSTVGSSPGISFPRSDERGSIEARWRDIGNVLHHHVSAFR